MARKRIETIISERIRPHTLNEKGLAGIAKLVKQYQYERTELLSKSFYINQE